MGAFCLRSPAAEEAHQEIEKMVAVADGEEAAGERAEEDTDGVAARPAEAGLEGDEEDEQAAEQRAAAKVEAFFHGVLRQVGAGHG